MTNNTPEITGIPDDCYFITLTLQPHMYTRKARRQYLNTVDKVEQILRVYTDEYWLMPELTKNVNVHYHVIAKWNENMPHAMDKYIDCTRHSKCMGMAKINEQKIIEKDRTSTYLLKDYVRTDSVINHKKDPVELLRHWKRTDKPPRPQVQTKLIDIIKYEDESDTREQIMQWAEDVIAVAPTAVKCLGNVCSIN